MIVAFVFGVPIFAKAQSEHPENKVTQQISFQHDNDFLLGIDRYYTAGTILGYSRIFNSHSQLMINVGQLTYTPRELFNRNVNSLERPFAGYLYIDGAISRASGSTLYTLTAEVGIAGPQSLAGDAQVRYHELINEFIPSWASEIANSAHGNVYGNYIADFSLPDAVFFSNLSLKSEVALGTRQIYAEQNIHLFLGRRAALSSSTAFGRLGAAPEFYGFVNVGYRYAALDALIQGHPWGDDSDFTLPIINSMFKVGAGGVYRGANNTYKIVYNIQSKSTAREGNSKWVSLIFARRF